MVVARLLVSIFHDVSHSLSLHMTYAAAAGSFPQLFLILVQEDYRLCIMSAYRRFIQCLSAAVVLVCWVLYFNGARFPFLRFKSFFSSWLNFGRYLSVRYTFSRIFLWGTFFESILFLFLFFFICSSSHPVIAPWGLSYRRDFRRILWQEIRESPSSHRAMLHKHIPLSRSGFLSVN